MCVIYVCILHYICEIARVYLQIFTLQTRDVDAITTEVDLVGENEILDQRGGEQLPLQSGTFRKRSGNIEGTLREH